MRLLFHHGITKARRLYYSADKLPRLLIQRQWMDCAKTMAPLLYLHRISVCTLIEVQGRVNLLPPLACTRTNGEQGKTNQRTKDQARKGENSFEYSTVAPVVQENSRCKKGEKLEKITERFEDSRGIFSSWKMFERVKNRYIFSTQELTFADQFVDTTHRFSSQSLQKNTNSWIDN